MEGGRERDNDSIRFWDGHNCARVPCLGCGELLPVLRDSLSNAPASFIRSYRHAPVRPDTKNMPRNRCQSATTGTAPILNALVSHPVPSAPRREVDASSKFQAAGLASPASVKSSSVGLCFTGVTFWSTSNIEAKTKALQEKLEIKTEQVRAK